MSSKPSGRSQTRHSIDKTLQGTTASRQQANGTFLTSVSSTKPQIQRKRCHLARRHYLSACHSLCDDNPTATLPAACLAQFVTMHQPPISHQLETILLASSLDAQTAKGNFVIKAGRHQPNSTCHQGKKQDATRSRQQANGTSLTSGSSTTPQIQTKRCHLARHHYRLPATVSAPTTCWQPCCQRCAWHTDILCSPNQQST